MSKASRKYHHQFGRYTLNLIDEVTPLGLNRTANLVDNTHNATFSHSGPVEPLTEDIQQIPPTRLDVPQKRVGDA